MVAVKKTSGGQSVPKSQHKVVPYQTDEMTGRPILPDGYKPSADEEYMNPLQLEYFRQRLQQWRADLVEESKQTIENLKEEVRDIGDEAERATRETENSLELRTRDRYRKLIGKIDSTLKRVDNGEYGFCVDTGEEIGLDRLEARRYTPAQLAHIYHQLLDLDEQMKSSASADNAIALETFVAGL